MRFIEEPIRTLVTRDEQLVLIDAALEIERQRERTIVTLVTLRGRDRVAPIGGLTEEDRTLAMPKRDLHDRSPRWISEPSSASREQQIFARRCTKSPTKHPASLWPDLCLCR